MLFGRPVNQWIGLVTSAASLLLVLIVQLRPDVDATVAATVIGAVTAFLGVFIAFLAGQPPTITDGQSVTVVTPEGQPNRVVQP